MREEKQKNQPKYLRLKQEILSWIHSGRLKPNDQIPSEHEIAEMFQVSRQTVRQTLGELEQEGWLHRIQGKGTFVSSPDLHRGPNLQTIGILTTYISDYIFPSIVRGAESALRKRGYRLLLASTDNDKAKERECLQMMMSHPLSGLIIEPTKSAEGNPNVNYYLALEYRNIPYVMINERYPGMDCACIKVDDEAGCFAATEHLIRLGHRRLAGFFKMDDLQGVYRFKGFLRAHREYQIPLMPDLMVHYRTEEKNVKPYECALSMLQRDDRPTAFVCYNDELAVQLLEAIRHVGLNVPQDVSIVGFDDSPLATATEVKLTTVTHPKAEMGSQAAEMLLDFIEKRRADQPEMVVHKPELVVRGSTGKI